MPISQFLAHNVCVSSYSRLCVRKEGEGRGGREKEGDGERGKQAEASRSAALGFIDGILLPKLTCLSLCFG